MPIKFRCVHCGQYLGISHSKAGTIVDCPTCGRSVGVPQKDGQAERVGRPSLNHEDSQLAEALREVAAIAQSSEIAMPQIPPERRPAADARETREVHAPPPKVVPAAPLAPARPIEPEPGGFIQPEALNDDSADDDEETFYERVPFKSLESLTTAEPVPAADPSRPEQSSYAQLPWTNEVPWKLWLAFIAVGFVAILAGFALGRWDRNKEPAAASPQDRDKSTEPAESAPPAIDRYADLLANFGEVSFAGSVTFARGDGAPVQKDAGAWVYAFPAEKAGKEKIPADWLDVTSPAEYGTDHALFVAALRVMGGNAVQAQSEGEFQLHLPQKGRYWILVCSGQIERDPDQAPTKEVIELLSEYVDDPDAFLDHRQHSYIASKECDKENTPIKIDTITP